jgi:hypothetical protein
MVDAWGGAVVDDAFVDVEVWRHVCDLDGRGAIDARLVGFGQIGRAR